MKETAFAVSGMTCGNCVRHVEGALKAIAGIAGVRVVLDEGKVFVQHEASGPTIESMLSAIDDAGYEARTLSSQ